MSMDLTGITNQNEYYTNHYFCSIFEENASETISAWRAAAKDSKEIKTPWAQLRDAAKQYYPLHDRYLRAKFDTQTLENIRVLADAYLEALGYPAAKPEWIEIDETLKVPVYLEIKKANGAPALWVLLAASEDKDAGILEKFCFSADDIGEEGLNLVSSATLTTQENEKLATKILFAATEPPRFLIFIGMNQIALIDRNKWNEKRYLQFELEEIFSRHEESTLQAMAVLLHRNSLCPEEGTALLDELDANSQKHAAGVSQDLKYALRESIELLGNEVLYDMTHRQGRNLETDPVDAGQLTLQCLRYMYRMLFVLFIEARPELGYAPIKAQSYLSGYSLESLRDIADNVRDDVDEVGSGYYLHETLSKLYELIYNGYPKTEKDIIKYSGEESLHDMFVIAPLKAHIFDPEYTKMITDSKLRNCVMLRIIDLMSLTRESSKKNTRRGRISYANLGINQMGAVYEALLSYRGFIAEHTLFEVKRAGDSFNELDVGYFVSEEELDQYTEEERVYFTNDEGKKKLRMYEKGHFIYRLAGREREKSASYYTPEPLTKCLVKYALKELLEGKTADEILNLTICEPAMGSAAFLNEAINQLAEAYIEKKQKELSETISYEDRFTELQKVKMYIADRNVYGIDLNPVAVELAEVSLWLNTVFEGGFVPWFGTQLVCGNSLIGARRQCYRVEYLTATAKGMRWYENAPERVPLGTKRQARKQVYHFLLGDPGMANYSDKVIKSLEPDNIKQMIQWNKRFNAPYDDEDIVTLLRLSTAVDDLWDAQINLRKQVTEKTEDALSVYGHKDDSTDSHTTIRQKDRILNELYKSEHMKNAGPYARLKFAMDYWCALWFWPIDKAELLPTRSEFFFDMSLILEGTMASVNVRDDVKGGQLSLFPTEMEQMAVDIAGTYGTDTVVDIPALRAASPRLNLAYEIAEQNHFMHWELEFADLFAERGGFDLILGNPPWRVMEWKINDVLGDINPQVAIKSLKNAEFEQLLVESLQNKKNRLLVEAEYISIVGSQQYMCSTQNYPELAGIKTDLYKCFLPVGWYIGSSHGICGFLHPEGVFDDAKGAHLRSLIYKKLRKHFQFENQEKLFPIGNTRCYSINIYGSEQTINFDSIFYLFLPHTIDDCYDNTDIAQSSGIKDENGMWNKAGNRGRIISVTSSLLKSLVGIFDDDNDWKSVKLPLLFSKDASEVLIRFNSYSKLAEGLPNIDFTEMWSEPMSTSDPVAKNVRFPEGLSDCVLSGPHIGVSNPLYKTPRQICDTHKAYDIIDLLSIPSSYLPRNKYSLKSLPESINTLVEKTASGRSVTEYYRLACRKMIDKNTERTLISAIIPPKVTHMDSLYSFVLHNESDLTNLSACFSSIPFDFYVKVTGKSNFRYDLAKNFPFISDRLNNPRVFRSLLLNCVSDFYADLWGKCWQAEFSEETWAKEDIRLPRIRCESSFSANAIAGAKNDYSRRELLIEIDVLVAMSIGMTLEQLCVIYRFYFPVLKQYEDDTWYDANGRIVFTNNRSLSGVGFSRPEWENGIKNAPAGQKFYRTITDDTMPGGPVERTIEYVAPFDRCDREQDYETAWKFFEEKYGK